MKKLYVGAAGVLVVVALLILFIGSVSEDKTAPSIRIRSEDILYSPDCSNDVLLAGVSATDDRDGNVSEHIVVSNRSEVSEGKVEIVTFTVSDDAGNVSSKDVVFITNDDGTFTLADYDAYSVDMDTLEISIDGIGVVGIATGNVIEGATGDNGNGDEEPSGEDQSSEEPSTSEEQPSDEPSTPEPTTPEPTTPEPTTPEPTTPEPSTSDEKPVMVLKNTEVTVAVGQELTWGNFWSKQVDEILDDKDSSNDLFKKITVLEDDIDTSTPGTYRVGYYCFDSDRNKSETVYLTVVVAENP